MATRKLKNTKLELGIGSNVVVYLPNGETASGTVLRRSPKMSRYTVAVEIGVKDVRLTFDQYGAQVFRLGEKHDPESRARLTPNRKKVTYRKSLPNLSAGDVVMIEGYRAVIVNDGDWFAIKYYIQGIDDLDEIREKGRIAREKLKKLRMEQESRRREKAPA